MVIMNWELFLINQALTIFNQYTPLIISISIIILIIMLIIFVEIH